MAMKFRASWIVICVGSVLLTACSSTPVAPTAAISAPVVTATPNTPATTSNTPVTSPNLATKEVAPYLDPRNPLSTERSVYFDFDKSSVASKYDQLLEMHGKYLASHPDVAIKIEGNTDEQGGSEYNLALGQKRADAVLKSLSILGVKASQMEAVSFGKEKPRALGNDEASYAQNRRADLAYPSK